MKILLVSEGEHELGGALETLVRRLIGFRSEFVAMDVRDPALRVHPGKGAGMFKKAVRCILHAQERGYDAVVVLIDQDDDRTRHRHLSEAQDYLKAPIQRAMGVAVRTFDAWMLADEQTLTSVTGTIIQRKPDPESVDDPKAECKLLLDCGGCAGIDLAEMYKRIMMQAKLELLEERCPKGFAPFAQRVRKLA